MSISRVRISLLVSLVALACQAPYPDGLVCWPCSPHVPYRGQRVSTQLWTWRSRLEFKSHKLCDLERLFLPLLTLIAHVANEFKNIFYQACWER